MCADILCTYLSNVIFSNYLKFPISASGFQGSLRRMCSSFWPYNEQLSCCLLVLDHFWITTQLLQLLVQTEPVIALDVTLTWPKYIFKDKTTSRCSLTSLSCPNIQFFMSRRNATFSSKVGETGVGEMGVGEQGPYKCCFLWCALIRIAHFPGGGSMKSLS